MRRMILLFPVLVLGPLSAGETVPKKILVAFASFRDRPLHPRIYFYEHDGIASGKIVGSIDPLNQRSDYRPSLSRDGRWCTFAAELENQTSRIFLWDMTEKKLVTLPVINDSPNAQLDPSINGAGTLLVFAAWDRAGFSQRWDLALYDLTRKNLVALPELNSQRFDERMPAFAAGGRYLAYVSNSKGGVGLSDVYLYDRTHEKVLPIPELNSPGMDIAPVLDEDARLVAFVSDRPGGAGGRDIFLFDRGKKVFVPLPGVNSTAQEQTPSLSADGRYLAFVSERLAGEGERDVYLYDRLAQKMLPAPGLNSKKDDFDPCVLVVD